MKKNIIISITILLSISILAGTLIIINNNSNDNKIKLQQMKESEEKQRQDKLTECINKAKTNRTNLWQANCPEKNKNCSLSNDTTKWIDNRHQQELESCYKLYN